MSTTANPTRKPQTPASLLPILTDLRQSGPTTAKAIDTDAIRLGRLEKLGLVKVVGKVHTGERGRPSNVYALTNAGDCRARRALKRTA